MVNKLTFGWAVPSFGGSGDNHIDAPLYDEPDFQSIKEAALTCEKLGFESLWIADHLILGRDWKIFECWTLLSSLASITERIRLGTLVILYALRYPSLLAKMASTLDVISKGRLDLGLGAGWNKQEAEAYGIPWLDKAKERIEQLIETIEILKLMWREEKASYRGKYYYIKDAICEPKPLQKPHPPIWIGSLIGEKLMPKVAAKYADGWNTILRPPDVLAKKIEILKNSCREINRDPETLKISIDTHILIAKDKDRLEDLKRRIKEKNPNYPSYTHFDPTSQKLHGVKEKLSWEEFNQQNFIGRPDEIIDRLTLLRKLGVSHVVLWFLDFPSLEGIKLFGEEVLKQF